MAYMFPLKPECNRRTHSPARLKEQYAGRPPEFVELAAESATLKDYWTQLGPASWCYAHKKEIRQLFDPDVVAINADLDLQLYNSISRHFVPLTFKRE